MDKTYEMLWDCPHCHTKKNLGLSHRHCPNCGGPQDASWRYFPADNEKVAVEDHVYTGVDLQCPYCGAYSSHHCKHCASCGAPLQGAPQAQTRQDQLTRGHYAGETREDALRERRQPGRVAEKQQSARHRWPWILAAACVVIGVVLVVGVFIAKRDATLRVAGHTWRRAITIERLGPVRDSDWCDIMPRGATNVTRSRQVRSHRKVPDGQDCSTRRIDRGDGTYVEKQECTARYRRVPVYDDNCSYTIIRWSQARVEELTGNSKKEEPRWPLVRLTRPGDCLGCEREGARKQAYVVRFEREAEGKQASCEFDQGRWSSFQVGERWHGKLSMIGGVLDCSALTRP